MKIAVLDIGSNTSLLLIGDLFSKEENQFQVKVDQVFFTRLAQNFYPSCKIQKKALERQELFFKTARKQIDKHLVDKVKAVATQTVREAKNKRDLITLGAHYGFNIEIISPLQEAQWTYKGALFKLDDLNIQKPFVLDIGGASTEIGFNENFKSFPFGSVYLTEAFLHNDPPLFSEIDSLINKVKQELKSLPPVLKNFTLVATAGTPTTLAGLQNQTNQVYSLHGEKMSYLQLKKWWHKLCTLSVEDRKKLKGMPSYRADVMPAGLSILKCIMEYFLYDNLIVSVTGLRYGLLSHQSFC